MALDFPREIAPIAADPFPAEWNKIVGRLRDLERIGAFRQAENESMRVRSEVKLQADLYRGVTDDKVIGRLVSWDGEDLIESAPVVELDIYGDRFGGFAFEGEIVTAELCGKNGRWYAIGAGHYHVRITLSATLNVGSSAAGVAADLAGTPAMTIYDYAMASGQSIASSKTFGAHWDSGLKKWTLPGPKCADVSG